MKTRVLLVTGALALAALTPTRVVQAQARMVVNIPFDFAAGDAKLPAGAYEVTPSEATRTVLLVNRENPETAAILPANSAQAIDIQAKSKLVFNRYGDRYFLSQVWIEGSSRGRQMKKSAREKEMATVAKLETQGQVALVASLAPANR